MDNLPRALLGSVVENPVRTTKILGIDPGSVALGWAILELDAKGRPRQCLQGVFRASSKSPFYERLFSISQEVATLVREHRPQAAAIENIFLGKNANSAFKLGHIRGACIVECQKVQAEIIEFSPREVKKIITGSGASDKLSLRRVLYQELGLSENPKIPLDASDALAMAYSHCLQRRMTTRWAQQLRP